MLTGSRPTSATEDTRSIQNKGVKHVFVISEIPTQTEESTLEAKLVGQKPPLKLKKIWAIRIYLQIDEKHRDLALFNLAIDSKLRACGLLKLSPEAHT